MTPTDESVNLQPDRRLYAVATVHLDTQWRWTVQDTIRDFIPATLSRNFELLERFPFFVVSFEGAFRYQLMKEYFPEQYEELRGWIADGRWRVAGSMLDAPDVNAVAPESLIRHILYGNGFFQREFGRRSCDIFLPDCFGFGWALPSIAAHCGLTGFSGQKFGRWMAPAEIPFDVGVWQGPDDSEVVAAIRPEGYGEGLTEDLSQAPRFRERLDVTGEQSGAFVGIKYVGVGDRGGGLDDESIDWIAKSLEGRGPVRVVLSGSDQIYQDLAPEQIARMPRHRSELLLPTHGTGCLTSQATLKRWNRRNELLADAAERAAVMADALVALPYPGALLEQAWTRFLWHQMHDDLTGTSIPAAYAFTDNDELLSLNQFASVLTQSIGAVTSRMDTRGDGHAIAVFNPLSIERQDVVTVELPEPLQSYSSFAVVGPDGDEVPSQQVAAGQDGKPTLLFLARVPPIGLQIYEVRPVESAAVQDGGLEVSSSGMANHRYRVELDTNGDVCSLRDLLNDRELLAAPIRWQLIRDRSARWPAWEILYQDLLAEDVDTVQGPAQIKIVENGPVRVSLEVCRKFGRSFVRQTLQLSAGDAGDRFEVVNEVDWRTRGRMLKASFSPSPACPVAIYDLGLGVIERGNNTREKYEVPAQQWAALSPRDRDGGMSILNDCKYGWDKPDDQSLRLTLLRSPRVIRKFRHQGWQDHGIQRFTYALFGHSTGWQYADSSWQAARLNQPLLAFYAPNHEGSLGKERSFLHLSTSQVGVQALKKSETGNRWIARVRELSGRPAESVRFESTQPIDTATEVNGMEDEIGPVEVRDCQVEVGLKPFEVRSLAVSPVDSKPVDRRDSALSVSLPFDTCATRRQGHPDRHGFDGSGHSIPAEIWPKRLSFGGVHYSLGPAAQDEANALGCRGQKLELPEHGADRLHLLVTSIDGPRVGRFRVDDSWNPLEIGPFSGFLGRRPRPPRFFWSKTSAPTLGDQHRLAWVGTHRHGPLGEDEPYVFCYLFRCSLAITASCREIELPQAPAIRIFAVSLAADAMADVSPAQRLYD